MKSINNLFSVKDKVIIVTGASGGNGSAMANGLEELGAIVVRADLPNCDVTNPVQLDMLVTDALQYSGRIDGLINCVNLKEINIDGCNQLPRINDITELKNFLKQP